MGMSDSKNSNIKKDEIENKEEIKEEVEISGSNLKKMNKELAHVAKSVCKIIFQYNNIMHNGTGFLIKLFNNEEPFFCLMTNAHIIKDEMIDSKIEIEIYYDYENKNKKIVLNKDERWIQSFILLDITFVEIIEEDNIGKDYYLLPYLDDINNLMNPNIYIPQFPNGELCSSEGKILEIKKYELVHNASTRPGSSGSPIFLKNSKKVIGIHKGGNETRKKNFGEKIIPIINWINGISIHYNDQYEGEYVNGKFEGKGKYTYISGSYYIGDWKNGKKNGKGKVYRKNGNLKIEGNFVDDKIEGYGKWSFENNDYYIGECKNDKINGKGKEYYKNGNLKYEGNYVDGKMEGYGKYIYEDEEYYIGEFKNDKKDGKGKYYYKNGNLKYDGNFADDTYEGCGKYIDEDGGYNIGEWKNGKQTGKGQKYYKNGNLQYEGNFIDGHFEGYGKFIYESGDYVLGDFKNGKANGNCQVFYKNGNLKFEGNLVNGNAEGYGKGIFENGEYYLGEWNNGKQTGKGKLFDKNGNLKYEGDFIDGKFEGNTD